MIYYIRKKLRRKSYEGKVVIKRNEFRECIEYAKNIISLGKRNEFIDILVIG